MLDAIIISDCHLGSPICQHETIQYLLDNLPETKRLIFNGDMLDSTKVRLNKSHWKILSTIRKWSDEVETIFIKGNHDFDSESIAHLIGAEFVDEYTFKSGSNLVCCIHGDIWDKFIIQHKFLTAVGDFVYLWLQRLDKSHRLATFAKLNSKTFLHCENLIRVRAEKYAVKNGYDIIICGHTHNQFSPLNNTSLPLYYNSGSFTERLCGFITVKDGNVDCHQISKSTSGDKPFIIGSPSLS